MRLHSRFTDGLSNARFCSSTSTRVPGGPIGRTTLPHYSRQGCPWYGRGLAFRSIKRILDGPSGLCAHGIPLAKEATALTHPNPVDRLILAICVVLFVVAVGLDYARAASICTYRGYAHRLVHGFDHCVWSEMQFVDDQR